MLFLHSKTTDPYFNIATEEYLLKNFEEDFFFLYVNEPSIIIGKHQNTIAEINVPYAIENNLKVVRRLSGGGTVFHDLGNLNYCFIQKGKEGFLVDFKKYSQPVINALQKLGVNAYLRGKSDLVIDDLKFSGNAEHVYRKKILHHGTMLFESELMNLNEAIKVNWDKFADKAVRSNRSKVTNIKDYLTQDINLDDFASKVENEALALSQDIEEYFLSDSDKAAINKLIAEKYNTWEWNYAYSPKYEFSNEITLYAGKIEVKLSIEKGLIKTIDHKVDGTIDKVTLSQLMNKLIGFKHDYSSIKNQIENYIHENPDLNIESNELIKLFF